MKGKIIAALVGAAAAENIAREARREARENSYLISQATAPQRTQQYPGTYTTPVNTGYQQHQAPRGQVTLRQPQRATVGISRHTSVVLRNAVLNAARVGLRYDELGRAIYNTASPLSTDFTHEVRQELRQVCRMATGHRHFSDICGYEYADIGEFVTDLYNNGDI